jgi:fatty-acyl-CoA synthase
MTEMSPIGSFATLRAGMEALEPEQRLAQRLKQGAPPYSVEMKLVDDSGAELPRDGVARGRLRVRGPGVVREYFKGEGGAILDAEGFFDTGDIASIDAYGFMQIADRAKDVIKSGGEWISSIELENLAMGCPGVQEAAAIAVEHPRWGERPLLVAVARPGASPSACDVIEFLRGRVAKWQLPDDVVFVDAIPHTATGKVHKSALRERFAGYRLPGQ